MLSKLTIGMNDKDFADLPGMDKHTFYFKIVAEEGIDYDMDGNPIGDTTWEVWVMPEKRSLGVFYCQNNVLSAIRDYLNDKMLDF